MFCSKCGNQLNDNAFFCDKCGAQIKTNTVLNLKSQSTQPEQFRKKGQKTERQQFEGTGKISVILLAIASLLSLIASIVIYIFVWFYIYNQPYITVSGWPLVIVNGLLNVTLLMMFSLVIVNLVHKKIITVICVLLVLDRLSGIYTSTLSVIRTVQHWADGANFVGDSFEIVVLKKCLGIVLSVVLIVAFILTAQAIKKQKKALTKILLVFWTIVIIYTLVSLFGKEMCMMRWLDVENYFSTLSTKLNALSKYLFLNWLLIKSRQVE